MQLRRPLLTPKMDIYYFTFFFHLELGLTSGSARLYCTHLLWTRVHGEHWGGVWLEMTVNTSEHCWYVTNKAGDWIGYLTAKYGCI
jgi:hypothetical protein